ncbi:uncharacterized protein DS421_13g443990 [Arachis hypogaea]|nr:uncharacterized protein DS421_13g443990 [Arachis hypogaea]
MCFNCLTFSKSRGWKFLSTSQASCDIQLNVDLAPFSSVTCRICLFESITSAYQTPSLRPSMRNPSHCIRFELI